MPLEDLDGTYFADLPWGERLARWLKKNTPENSFLQANVEAVEETAGRSDLLLRMVLNIPAHALLLFLHDRHYKNTYERTAEAGAAAGNTHPPSKTRRDVDAALFPAPATPEGFYFGAVALGGTGIRYYGDYCLVLKSNAVEDETQILDRNSYDIVDTPLSTKEPLPNKVVERLRGKWREDLLPIVKLKVLPELGGSLHRGTAGVFSEALLHDESFIEVHKRGHFGPEDVHEIRESAADPAVVAALESRRQRGYPLTPDEEIWLARRQEVERELSACGLSTRIVVTSGRTPR